MTASTWIPVSEQLSRGPVLVTTDGSWYVFAGAGVVALVVGVALLGVTVRLGRQYRYRSTTTPTDAARIEPDDPVAVTGTVETARNRTVRGYVGETDPVLRRTSINRGWPTRWGEAEKKKAVHESYDAVPFDVVDATGEIRVVPPERKDAWGDLASFRGSIDPDATTESLHAEEPVPDWARAYAADHDLAFDLAGDSRSRIFHVEERLVKPGDEVSVHGEAVVDDDGVLVVSGQTDPTGFTVTHADEEDETAGTSPVFVGFIGVIATVATLVGMGLIVLGLLAGPLG